MWSHFILSMSITAFPLIPVSSIELPVISLDQLPINSHVSHSNVTGVHFFHLFTLHPLLTY